MALKGNWLDLIDVVVKKRNGGFFFKSQKGAFDALINGEIRKNEDNNSKIIIFQF